MEYIDRSTKGVTYCACGCGQPIEFKEYHMRKGTPKYIAGHSNKPHSREAMQKRIRAVKETRGNPNKLIKRDKWTCQKCNEQRGKLHVHHIFNFADHSNLRLNKDNGMTLCVTCHTQFHKVYGTNLTNLVQLTEYLQNE